MHEINLNLSDNGRGSFVVEEGNEIVAKLDISIAGNNLTVFHTEVNEKLKGQGVASQLLSAMVDYARMHNKKVIALCSYVLAQFQRHEDQYADIWNKDWHNRKTK